jgi:hypothetical protein
MRLDTGLEQPQQGAQPAHSDAHLVDALHLAAPERRRLIGEKLVQRGVRERGEGGVQAQPGVERDRLGFPSRGARTVVQAVAAVGLTLHQQ